ncbi:MAG: hypothetical protein AB7P49_18130 [Bdellovibrionales bacterium]
MKKKQYCFQRYNCANGTQYHIVYLVDKSQQNNRTTFLGFCTGEDTTGGIDSCANTSQTDDVRACQEEAIQKGVISNPNKSQSQERPPSNQQVEAETAKATS